MVEEYLSFLSNLVSAQTVYLRTCLKMVVSHFTPGMYKLNCLLCQSDNSWNRHHLALDLSNVSVAGGSLAVLHRTGFKSVPVPLQNCSYFDCFCLCFPSSQQLPMLLLYRLPETCSVFKTELTELLSSLCAPYTYTSVLVQD